MPPPPVQRPLLQPGNGSTGGRGPDRPAAPGFQSDLGAGGGGAVRGAGGKESHTHKEKEEEKGRSGAKGGGETGRAWLGDRKPGSPTPACTQSVSKGHSGDHKGHKEWMKMTKPAPATPSPKHRPDLGLGPMGCGEAGLDQRHEDGKPRAKRKEGDTCSATKELCDLGQSPARPRLGFSINLRGAVGLPAPTLCRITFPAAPASTPRDPHWEETGTCPEPKEK